MEDKIIKLYENYGKIKKHASDKKSETNIYMFECDIENIVPEEEIFANTGMALSFLIVHRLENNSVTMYCFGLSKKDSLGKKPLEIMNEANSTMKYGKFIIDKDDDLNWEITYDYETADSAEIENYIVSCIKGIIKIVALMRGKE